ncbi:MAG: hypothetical protein AAGK97_18215, partial [Bacteroidota bacterium]
MFLIGQEDLKIYGWKSYLPFQEGRYVTQSEDKIFYATEAAIVSVEKQTRAPEFFSKVDGLSEVGISLIKYSPFADVMLVAYNSSIIDLVKEEGIRSFNDIPENRNISGDKSILDITYENERWAYIATAFGVIQFDTEREEFGFTVRMNLRVNALTINDNKIYAGTEEGVYFAPLDQNLNLGDFSQWTFLGANVGLPDFYECRAIGSFNGKVYLDRDGMLYAVEGNNSRFIYQEDDKDINYISAEGKDLLVGFGNNTSNGKVYFFDTEERRSDSGNLCSNQPLFAIQDQFDQVWYADVFRNFRVAPRSGLDCEAINFNSPRFASLSEINV